MKDETLFLWDETSSHLIYKKDIKHVYQTLQKRFSEPELLYIVTLVLRGEEGFPLTFLYPNYVEATRTFEAIQKAMNEVAQYRGDACR